MKTFGFVTVCYVIGIIVMIGMIGMIGLIIIFPAMADGSFSGDIDPPETDSNGVHNWTFDSAEITNRMPVIEPTVEWLGWPVYAVKYRGIDPGFYMGGGATYPVYKYRS